MVFMPSTRPSQCRNTVKWERVLHDLPAAVRSKIARLFIERAQSDSGVIQVTTTA